MGVTQLEATVPCLPSPLRYFDWGEKAKTPAKHGQDRGQFAYIKEPGTELFSQGATPQVSSPQQRFTIEFGMGSKWFHCASNTRKTVGFSHFN